MTERRQLLEQVRQITNRALDDGRELTAAERREADDALARINAIDAEQRKLVAPRGEPERHDDLTQWLRSGGNGVRTAKWVGNEKRFLATSPASAGGALRPTDFEETLWRSLELTSPILNVARVFATAGGRDLQLPIATSSGSAVARTEGSAIAGVDPAFDQITLKDHQYAQLIRVTNEVRADAGVDLAGYLAEAMAANIDKVVGPLWTFGTGVTEPQGYASSAGSAVVGTTAGFTYDDLLDTIDALEPQHQANAVWMFSPSALTELRRLKDDESRPLWQPAVAAGAPATLFGRPVFTDVHLAPVAAGGTSVACIDPAAFAVRLADGGVQIESSRDAFFAENMTAWRSILRTDSALLYDGAAAVFVGGSGTA